MTGMFDEPTALRSTDSVIPSSVNSRITHLHRAIQAMANLLVESDGGGGSLRLLTD